MFFNRNSWLLSTQLFTHLNPKNKEKFYNTVVHFNILKGCSSSGVYGDFCNETCPEHCRENACSIINGTCYGCAPGWVGDYCNDSKIDCFSTL